MLSKFKKTNRKIFQRFSFLKEITWQKKVTKGFLERDNENTFYSSSHLTINKKNHITLINTLLAPSGYLKHPTYISMKWANKLV